jgi:hypothetical protein
LQSITCGNVKVDKHLKAFLLLLKRWIIEAPRKRFYRKLSVESEGKVILMGGEYFFQKEKNGEEIIDNLENTGKFAEYFLKEIYDTDEMPDTSYRTDDRTKDPLSIDLIKFD